MFNDLLQDSANVILVARLNRSLTTLTSAGYSTLEEYQAAIYSDVNKILALQNTMQPLNVIRGQTPALIGNLSANINNLNNDAVDTVSQLIAVENDVANLFNLGEASQTSIRQVIRQHIFSNNLTSYVESFINNANIQTNTAQIDYLSAAAYLPISSSKSISYSLSLGTSSSGSSTSLLTSLTDGIINTSYVWSGQTLELIIGFDSPQIVNRLVIDLDVYDGLKVTGLSSSPDGTIFNDLLQLLGVSTITLDASSGKYSGSVVIDFPAQFSTNIQLTLNNVIGSNSISLRNISLYAIQYSNSGQLTSTLINNPLGNTTFSTDQFTTSFTNIVHQYSYDNVNFTVISPNTQINFVAPYWYRALLSRTNTSTTSTGLTAPANSTNYSLTSSNTLSLGSNITERTIVLSSITGAIVLSETPLLNSLKLQVNSTFLNSSQYTFVNNTITLNSNQSNLTIIYQTSGLNAQTLASLQNYYTPILRQFQFEA